MNDVILKLPQWKHELYTLFNIDIFINISKQSFKECNQNQLKIALINLIKIATIKQCYLMDKFIVI